MFLGLIVAACVAAAVWLICSPRLNPKLYDRSMFKPNEERGDRDEFKQLLAAHRSSEFWIKNRSGNKLHAWLLGPAHKAPYLLFYSMGKDGDIARRARTLTLLLETGVPVFIYEYSGFGQSEGTPTLQTLCDDAVDVFDIACSIGFKPEQIVLYGESLGVSISSHLLKHRQAGGLIAKSGFSSLVRIAKEIIPPLHVYPKWMFPQPQLDTCENLTQAAPVPLLVIHGKKDRLAKPHHAEQMIQAASQPGRFLRMVWLNESRHSFIQPVDEPLFADGVRHFLNSLPLQPVPATTAS